MPNVNHRYSSESWTLDLTGKRSPLSRWTGQTVLRDEQFRLSLLGVQGGIAPVVWLSGDRPCFEALHKVVEAYVQQGLGQRVLAGASTFPSGSQSTLAQVQPSGAQPSTAPSSEASPAATKADPKRQFSLEALDQLRHNLNYTPQDSSSPRQMQLSTLQLADLLTVLDQWQTETLSLPESNTKLRVLPGGQGEFVMPTWGRIAASLVAALGATGVGAYVLSQRLPGLEQQVTQESAAPATEDTATANDIVANSQSAFGAFPTASGPPITSQAQDGDAPFNSPLSPPSSTDPSSNEAAALPTSDPLPPPNVTFPTPLPSGDLSQIPVPAPAVPGLPSDALPTEIPGETTAPEIASAGSSADDAQDAEASGSTTLSGTATASAVPPLVISSPSLSVDPPLVDAIPPSTSAPSTNDRSASTGAPSTIEDTPLSIAASDEPQPETEAIVIPMPEVAITPSPVGTQAQAGAIEGGAVGNATAGEFASSPTAGTAIASPVEQTTIAATPATQPAAKAPSALSSAPAAPPVPQVTVANPLPANNQSRAMQSYLQSQWKPPSVIQQPLQYRLSIAADGKLASVEALSPAAQLYVNDANLPSVGSPISGATDNVGSTMVVTLTPAGTVDVAIERTTPAP